MNAIIQMYDPTRDYVDNKMDYDNAMATVLKHGLFINGPEVSELEKKLQELINVKCCVTCANGTDALFIALKSLNIGTGDEVITVSHTWISTCETISLVGAVPIFVDIDQSNYNIDINKIENNITAKTKAILFVSLYGLMPDMEKIKYIAEKHNLYLIEDGAQSFGAKFKESFSCSCKYTHLATTSFFPSKPLGCWGDGGAIFTNDIELAKKIRALKSHGGIERFKHKYIGMNSRLDTLQASILLVKLNNFNTTLKKRNQCANYYTEKLSIIKNLKLPTFDENIYYHAWAQYSLLCQDKTTRDELFNYFKKNNVNTAIFYPIGVHRQECFNYLPYKELRVTDSVCDRIFNLPCYGEITQDEQDYIVNLIFKFFNK